MTDARIPDPPLFESIVGPVKCPNGCGESVYLNMSDHKPWRHECEFDAVDVAEGLSGRGGKP